MPHSPWRRPAALALVTALLGAVAAGPAAPRDLWIHPRGETFDPARHYKDVSGELYYRAENDINRGLGAIVANGGPEPSVTAELGPDMWEFVLAHGGALRPVILYDSDGDGRVDRSVRGRIENGVARFDGPGLAAVDLRGSHWQLGVLYVGGKGEAAPYVGRYLASVDSHDAKVEYPRLRDLAKVESGPRPGLVILKHRAGEPFDFAAFAARPSRAPEGFDRLTPEADADDWTVKGAKGRLRTHFGQENLFLVHTEGGADLSVVWGDVPLARYASEWLRIAPGTDGCYSGLASRVEGSDGRHAPLPHRLLYCPRESLALFDAPPGYEIGLSALESHEVLERTQASSSVLDNVRLYAWEVNPRSPLRRATGSVWGNIEASFRDAGHDVLDIGRHAFTGTTRTNLHDGQQVRRTSALAAVPMFLVNLARLRPLDAGGSLIEGVESGVQVGADAVSAVNDAVINPLLQLSVGSAASPHAADVTGHWIGAFTQAASQNLPASERSMDALSPFSAWHHDRSFQPVAYTRTDTQLNIDRVMTLANIFAVQAIAADAAGGGHGHAGPGGGGPPTPTPSSPPPAPPPPVLPPPWGGFCH